MNNEKQNVEIILYKNNDMSSMTCSSKSSSTKTSTSKTGTQRLLLLLCPPATAMLYVVYLTDPHFTRVQDKSQDHCTYIMETTPLVSGQKKFHLRPFFRSWSLVLLDLEEQVIDNMSLLQSFSSKWITLTPRDYWKVLF